MKTEVLSINTKPSMLKYPVIARFKEQPLLIVMFDTEKTGTVLSQSSDSVPLGTHSDEWIACTVESAWEILDNITIKFTSEKYK